LHIVDFDKYFNKKKTLLDPFKCSPIVHAKWKKARNIIILCLRLEKIWKQVGVFGTSKTLLDVERRGIQKVRDVMLPHYSTVKIMDVQEKLIEDEKDWMIFENNGFFMKLWSTVLTIILAYSATIMPYRIAFYEEDETSALFYVDSIIDFLFMFDIFVNLNIPLVESSGAVISYSRYRIFKHYLKTWLIIDLFSSLPFNLITKFLSSSSLKKQNLIKIIRLPKLYKLLKIARLIKIMKLMKQSMLIGKAQELLNLNSGVIRLIKFFATVFICVHLVGCLWVMVANLEEFKYTTWVYTNDLQDADNGTLYLAALYWAFSTLLTVGYGDIHAFTNGEMVLALFWMIIGGSFYTFAIGNLSSMLSNLDTRES
jgi:hypothetical protein